MMRYIPLLLILISGGCENKPTDQMNDLREIKNILDTERKAHLTKDIDLFLKNSLATDTLYDVSRGRVRIPTLEQSRERFTNYFNAVEFIKWDDVAEPVFYFSDDSTMATVIIQKQVILKEIATSEIDTSNFAWTAVYKKKDGQWKMKVITSTTQ